MNWDQVDPILRGANLGEIGNRKHIEVIDIKTFLVNQKQYKPKQFIVKIYSKIL